jgi:ketosteroid isomerase-like protein
MATNKGPRDEILSRIESVIGALQDLRRQIGIDPASPPGLAQSLHDAFVGYTLSQLSRFSESILRPISRKAVWIDMPTLKQHDVSQTEELDRQNWRRAFPDFREEVVNVIGNEKFMIVERRASGTHQGSLKVGKVDVAATRKKFAIETAEVVKIENGEAVQIEHYYDIAGVLRTLGLMKGTPIGHDEPGAMLPAVLHASGFLRPDPATGGTQPWPTRVGRGVSIGRSDTGAAQRNARNCTAIHEAFIEHKPERFSQLISKDAVWIDVPTGQVLNGAVAAAHHDHSNWQMAFPDSSAEVTNMIANDDWVGVQHRGFGTHGGPLQLAGKTYPPTGRKVDIRVLDLVQYRDGTAVLIRNYYDMGMMLVQLGIVPQ